MRSPKSRVAVAALVSVALAACASEEKASQHANAGAAGNGLAAGNGGTSSVAGGAPNGAGTSGLATGGGAATPGAGSGGAPMGGQGAGGTGSTVGGASGQAGSAAGRGGGAGTPSAGSAGDASNAGAANGTPVEEGVAFLPGVRQEHGVVGLKGEVYVLGGYTPDITSSVMAYDPAKDSWRDVADFPSPFNHPAAGVVSGVIYVGGFYAGTSLTGPATGDTYAYDPTSDQWTLRASLPDGTARAGGCVAVLGTDMYVFGGGNSGDATDFASVYDTAGDRWRALPKLPETREHCSAFVSQGKIYIAGGRTHTIPEFRPSTLEFDPDAQTYTEKTPIPTPRGGAAGAVLAGRLFLFGGEGADNPAGVFPDIQAYDAVTDSWESFPPMIVPRHGYGAVTVGDRIYLPGGATRQGGAASDVVTVFYFE